MSLTIHYAHWRKGVIAGLLCSALVASPALAAGVAEPVFESPAYGASGIGMLPVIQGKTERGTVVDIRIDGISVGRATLSASDGSLAQFSFTPLEPLTPGYHSLEAFAADPTGEKTSRQSLWWFVQVKGDLSAPVLYKVMQAGSKKVVVQGVVRSGYRVRVYVDGVARVTSDVMLHASGARGFSIALTGISPGAHEVTISAVRQDGLESAWSPVAMVQVQDPPPAAQGQSPATQPGSAPAAPQGNTLPGSQPSVLGETGTGAETATSTPPVPPSPSPVTPPKGPQGSGVAPSVRSNEIKTATTSEANTATRTATATQEEVPSAPSQTNKNLRTPLLIILGIILIALIIWYATRSEGGGSTGSGGAKSSVGSNASNPTPPNPTGVASSSPGPSSSPSNNPPNFNTP